MFSLTIRVSEWDGNLIASTAQGVYLMNRAGRCITWLGGADLSSLSLPPRP